MTDRGTLIKEGRRIVAQHGQEMTDLYESGKSLKEVAEVFGISFNTVANVVRRHGGTVRTHNGSMGHSKEVVRLHGDAIWQAYDEGETMKVIGERYGIGQAAIRHAVRTRGGTIRKRGYGGLDRSTLLRENTHGWNGGTFIKNGYVMQRLYPDDRFFDMAQSSRYVCQHRLVMAQAIGRSLTPEETVHHINGDTTDNNLANLQLRFGRHGKGSHWRCNDCGSQNVAAVEI